MDDENGTNLTFEQAMSFLRDGCRITRACFDPLDRKSLAGNIDAVYGSFYMTIFDVLAEDWMVVDFDWKTE